MHQKQSLAHSIVDTLYLTFCQRSFVEKATWYFILNLPNAFFHTMHSWHFTKHLASPYTFFHPFNTLRRCSAIRPTNSGKRAANPTIVFLSLPIGLRKGKGRLCDSFYQPRRRYARDIVTKMSCISEPLP